MAETFHNLNFNKKIHSTFGGLIYESDFNTCYKGVKYNNGSNIAARIISDQKFDTLCKMNAMNRDNRKEND